MQKGKSIIHVIDGFFGFISSYIKRSKVMYLKHFMSFLLVKQKQDMRFGKLNTKYVGSWLVQ
jgi:hypothetical protein